MMNSRNGAGLESAPPPDPGRARRERSHFMSVKSHKVLRAAAARGLLGMLLVLTASAAPALANRCENDDRDDEDGRTISAPEIDPGSMLGGLTLLAGGAFILADRRCRTKPQFGAD
jgi:hypothetical protein